MQKRLWLGVLLVGFPTACLVGSGCGGSSTETPADGGTDASLDVKVDVVEVVEAARCDDADLNDLNLPDAALGDSGATTGTCFACTQASCAEQISACNASCSCKNGVDDAFNCIASSGSLSLSCVAGLGSDPSGKALGLCIYASCTDPCGLGAFVQNDAGEDAD